MFPMSLALQATTTNDAVGVRVVCNGCGDGDVAAGLLATAAIRQLWRLLVVLALMSVSEVRGDVGGGCSGAVLPFTIIILSVSPITV